MDEPSSSQVEPRHLNLHLDEPVSSPDKHVLRERVFTHQLSIICNSQLSYKLQPKSVINPLKIKRLKPPTIAQVPGNRPKRKCKPPAKSRNQPPITNFLKQANYPPRSNILPTRPAEIHSMLNHWTDTKQLKRVRAFRDFSRS